MKSVVDSEVHTHFAEILKCVEHGEPVAVTRDGRHVATIVPATHASASDVDLVYQRVRERRDRLRREGNALSQKQILEGRDEGRR